MKAAEKIREFLKKHSMMIVLSFAVIISALSIVIGIIYTRSMSNSLWEQIVADITEVTAQGGRSFEMYIKNESDSLDVLVDKLKHRDPGSPETEGEDFIPEAVLYLREHISTSGYYSLAIFEHIDGEPSATDKVYTYIGSDNTSGKQGVRSDYAGYTGKGITEPYLNRYDGKRTLGYYQCFKFEGSNREGILRRGQPVSDVNNDFSLSFYNNKGFSYIVKRDGNIMVRPTHRNSNRTGTNLFSILEYDNSSTHEADMLRKVLNTGKKGAMLSTEGKEERVISFVPLKNIDELSIRDWYIVSIVPNTAVSQHVESVLQSSVALTVIVVLIVIIFALFLVVILFSTKRVSAKETEVKYREQLFGILANNTDDVFILLPHGQLAAEYISPNISRVLGIDDADVKADIRAIGDPENSEDRGGEEEFNRAKEISDGEKIAFDNTTRKHKKTGETHYFRETVYRASIDGIDKDIIVISDRTNEKTTELALKNAIEAAEAANSAKSAFLSNMSHDIRTPMNAILGFTELIKRDINDPAKAMQYINKINASGQHLLGLINDVLDMSKIESGKMVLNLQSFSLAEFVNELDSMMRPQANAKDQSFDIITKGLRTENVIGDKLRINQILINILSNAVKYTPVGGKITMEITELPRINENFAHLRIIIADNGFGMSEEYQKVIFNPFTREISSTTNSIQGTGLGMAITKNLVDLLGGKIEVKSKLGEGSTFTVEFELRIEAEDVNNEFWSDHGIKRALIVDDEQDICDHVKESLEDAGLKTDFALSGQEAVELLTKQRGDGDDINLVLLDLKMPGMDGIETAQKIRDILADKATILILTSYDWGDFEDSARVAGINAFLPKPFFVSNLKHSISELYKKNNAEKEGEQENILEGRHMLVAEDNELNAEILSELLSMYDATCDIMQNGQLAVDKFTSSAPGTYDMVLMDVQMPVMNGYDATRAIRASDHPEAKTIPIIAMTANAFAEDISAALDSGMNAHIAKPLDMSKLEEVCRQLLGSKKQ